MKSVAAIADAHVIRLFPLRTLAAEDREQPEDDALVRYAIEVVELCRRLVVGPGRIRQVGAGPLDRLVLLPARAGDEVGRLPVPAKAMIVGRRLIAQAEDPYVPERVEEKRRPIAGWTRAAAFAPVNAVWRCVQHEIKIVPHRHLVAAVGIGVREIEPDGRRVAESAQRDVGAFDDVEGGLFPGEA